ncbi:MAG: hypothetical protein QXZ22_09310 [Sulfolobales archaeon]
MAQEERSQKVERLPKLFIRFEVAQYARVLYVSDEPINRPIIDLNSYFFDYINSHYYSELLDFIEWFETKGKNKVTCDDKTNEIMIWKDYSPQQEWGDSFTYWCKDKKSFSLFLKAIKNYIG